MKISKELEDRMFAKYEEQMEIMFGEVTNHIKEAIDPLYRKVHIVDLDTSIVHSLEIMFDNLMESKHKQMNARDKARAKREEKLDIQPDTIYDDIKW